jgi:hypothetical protein
MWLYVRAAHDTLDTARARLLRTSARRGLAGVARRERRTVGVNDYQNPQWPPYPPQEGQSTTVPSANPGGAWDQIPDGAPPAPFVISPEEPQSPPAPFGGEPTSPSWYSQPSYPPPPAYPPAPTYPPAAPEPIYPLYPPPPAPSQPLGGYAPPPSQPLGGYALPPSQPLGGYPGGMAYSPPGYGAPSQPLKWAASQPIMGYRPAPSLSWRIC